MRALTIALSLAVSAAVLPAETASERLNETANVFSEIMQTPDKGIPQDLLEKAQCIIILPGLKKAAFVVGGEYGRGFAECRNASGKAWGAPTALKLEGGSLGFQIGGSSTDLVMLVMNERGMEKLLGDKFTLGADASVAAGPVGRTARAATDVKMDAEILAWSRAKGLFAGVSLNGASIHNDADGNAELYGRKQTNREVLTGGITPPAAARRLNAELNKYSYRKDTSSAEPHDQ
jgi:lipid-binding SYLF domain-containing protein